LKDHYTTFEITNRLHLRRAVEVLSLSAVLSSATAARPRQDHDRGRRPRHPAIEVSCVSEVSRGLYPRHPRRRPAAAV